MSTPRDIGALLNEAGAFAMTVVIPVGDHEGWRVNLRREGEGWHCGPVSQSFDEALDAALKVFVPWGKRQKSEQPDDDFEDLLEDLLG